MRNVLIAMMLTLLMSATAWSQPIIGGFVEANQAVRVEQNEALDAVENSDLGEREYPRSEFRAQLTVRDAADAASFFLRVDVVSEGTDNSGTAIDLREAYLKLYLLDWLDIKVGRQVATWGTGDLIFANDLFAKDWEAFFTALDDTYLKPPQDLLRLSFYLGGITAEVATSPHFTPDNLPDGTRLSVYNPFVGVAVDVEMAPAIDEPLRSLRNGEVFARTYGSMGSAEWALYGYKGFWPTPQGATTTGMLYYPRMWSLGASYRRPVGSMLVHAEGAAYISQDDPDGDDPMIANSQLRGFVGTEKSLGNDWTLGGQYYAEYMLDYDKYQAGLRPGGVEFDELRSTVTVRVTKFILNQNLQFSGFAYWGLSDSDWHLRPSISYKLTDEVNWTLGASLVGGDKPYTMFGQFRDNSNVFTRVRYSF